MRRGWVCGLGALLPHVLLNVAHAQRRMARDDSCWHAAGWPPPQSRCTRIGQPLTPLICVLAWPLPAALRCCRPSRAPRTSLSGIRLCRTPMATATRCCCLGQAVAARLQACHHQMNQATHATRCTDGCPALPLCPHGELCSIQCNSCDTHCCCRPCCAGRDAGHAAPRPRQAHLFHRRRLRRAVAVRCAVLRCAWAVAYGRHRCHWL